MQIRQARVEDVNGVMELVARIVPIMRASGNLQWDDEYPNAAVFEHDAELEQLRIVEIEGEIAALAAITTDQKPEYAQVGWDITETAIAVHRPTVDPAFRGKGIAAALMLQAEVAVGAFNLSNAGGHKHLRRNSEKVSFNARSMNWLEKLG